MQDLKWEKKKDWYDYHDDKEINDKLELAYKRDERLMRWRVKHQDAFLMEDVDVIVATIAFGMGIDKL